MATMKLVFISLTLFILLEVINARQLHDAFMKGSFNERPPSHATIIQMVTGEELRLPQYLTLSLSHDKTTYGRVNSSPPLPKGAPPRGQTTYGRVNSSPPIGPNKFGRDDPRTPPSPNPNDSQGHGMYGRVDPSAPAPPKPADPTRPLVSDGGSACTGLSTSAIDGWAKLRQMQVAFYRLLSYVTRVFE